jgi:urease accessory protein
VRVARRGALIAWVTFVALAQAPAPARAHGSVRGLGNFLGGAVHPLVEPAQLIVLVALGLFIGQRGLVATRPAWLCFVSALVAGLVGAGVGGVPTIDAWLLPLAGLLGLAVLCDLAVPRLLCAFAAGLVGLGVGLACAPELVTGQARVVMLLGSGAGAAVGMFNIVGLLHEAHRPWQRIGMRVVGSWIVASVTLVMSLSMAGALRLPS